VQTPRLPQGKQGFVAKGVPDPNALGGSGWNGVISLLRRHFLEHRSQGARARPSLHRCNKM